MRFRSERSVARLLQDVSAYVMGLETRMIRDVIPDLLDEFDKAASSLEMETQNLSQRLMMLKKCQRHLLAAQKLADERRIRKEYLPMDDAMCLIRIRHYCISGALLVGVGMKDLREGVQFPPQAA